MNKLKVLTVAGARPQFIKSAVISRLIRDVYHEQITEVLVHTGQHYDQNMSNIFFTDMAIPKPGFHLEVNEKTHGAMTGKMLQKLEGLMLSVKPDLVLVYGDTNSTLAGALAAAKLNIPIAHVEAGLRSFWKKMPEEQNRILTDHLSSYFFCPTHTAVQNLNNEGISSGVFETGDIMMDSFEYYKRKLKNRKLCFKLNNRNLDLSKSINDRYSLLTLHRAENTSSVETLSSIFKNLGEINSQIIFPIHPRTGKALNQFNLDVPKNVLVIDPVGYYELLHLLTNCESVITDSGGLQKEAYFARKPCFTLRNQTEWVETLENGWNVLLNPSKDFADLINNKSKPGAYCNHFGKGDAGRKILEYLRS